jgi:hypothetical protein
LKTKDGLVAQAMFIDLTGRNVFSSAMSPTLTI